MIGFPPPDPATSDYSHLENLACGYWHSEVFFVALNLDLFSKLDSGTNDLQTFARKQNLELDGLKRLFPALQQLGLLEYTDGYWFPTQRSSTYLSTTSPDCLLDFFLYRQYMQKGWQNLRGKIGQAPAPGVTPESSYEKRNLYYVKALDLLARQKSSEIIEQIKHQDWQGPVLDIGGGAGALCRALIADKGDQHGVIFDLAEVHQAARTIYQTPEDWHNIEYIEGNFTSHAFTDQHHFGLVIMSNFLHAYDSKTAQELLVKACALLKEDGLLLIHDYFPDRKTDQSSKAVLYDLHMLANTYNGACHGSKEIISWLQNAGIEHAEAIDLETDSSLILASPSQPMSVATNWFQVAIDHGFRTSVVLDVKDVITAPWVPMKCQFGCEKFGKGLQCPPFSMEVSKTRELLNSYTTCMVVESTPPGDTFHEQLLALERTAFLQGHHKALVFGAGPCTLCPTCDIEKPCVQPAKARPAMEACGIDVYETMQKAGLALSPRTSKDQYIKYIGLLLIK